jgi:hypothetical protein
MGSWPFSFDGAHLNISVVADAIRQMTYSHCFFGGFRRGFHTSFEVCREFRARSDEVRRLPRRPDRISRSSPAREIGEAIAPTRPGRKKSEIRDPKCERSPKTEIRIVRPQPGSVISGLRASDFFRIWAFGLRVLRLALESNPLLRQRSCSQAAQKLARRRDFYTEGLAQSQQIRVAGDDDPRLGAQSAGDGLALGGQQAEAE